MHISLCPPPEYTVNFLAIQPSDDILFPKLFGIKQTNIQLLLYSWKLRAYLETSLSISIMFCLRAEEAFFFVNVCIVLLPSCCAIMYFCNIPSILYVLAIASLSSLFLLFDVVHNLRIKFTISHNVAS